MATPSDPSSNGRRTPIRSERRPAPTASHIGRNEYIPINAPTTNGDSVSDSA